MKTLPNLLLIFFSMAHISTACAEIFTLSGDSNTDKYDAQCYFSQRQDPIKNDRAARLQQQLVKLKATPDTLLPQELLNSIASDYQPVISEVIFRVQEIQKKSSDPKLHIQGNINNEIKLIILNSDNEAKSASSKIDRVTATVYIPSRLIVNLMQKVQANHRRLGGFGINCQVPLHEFDDAIRLIIAHEVTHIWLHKSNRNVYDREIEADAWGIILSNFDSEISKRNRTFEKAQASMYADINAKSIFDPSHPDTITPSIMQSNQGFEIADILYDDTITDSDSGRQSGAERRKNIKAKYDEIQKQLLKKLKAALQKTHDSVTSMPEYQEDQKRRRTDCLNKLDKELVNNQAKEVLGKDSRTNAQKEFEAQVKCGALGQMQWLEFCRKNPKLESCAGLGDLVADSSAKKETKKYQKPESGLLWVNPSGDTFSTTGDFSIHVLINLNGITDENTFLVKTKPSDQKEYCDAVAKSTESNDMTILSCKYSGAAGEVIAQISRTIPFSFRIEWSDR